MRSVFSIPCYRLTWVATKGGVEVVTTSEPDVSGLFEFGLWLVSPLAPEELL
jgi:hypothetical protein